MWNTIILLTLLLTFVHCASWTPFSYTGGPMNKGPDSEMVYDPVAKIHIIVGGATSLTWGYSVENNSVTLLSSDVGFSCTGEIGFAYDPDNQVSIFVGCSKTSVFSTVNMSWTVMSPTAHPITSIQPVMAYDTYNHRMLYSGGTEFWAYTYGDDTWTSLTSPTKGSAGSFGVFDTNNNVFMLYSGYTTPGFEIYDAVTNTWEVRTEYSTRCCGSAVFHPSGVMILVSGFEYGPLSSILTYRYSTDTWTDITNQISDNPGPRFDVSMSYNTDHDILVVYGGGGTGEESAVIFHIDWTEDIEAGITTTVEAEITTTLEADPGSTTTIEADPESTTTIESDPESTTTIEADPESSTTIESDPLSSDTETDESDGDVNASAPIKMILALVSLIVFL